MAASLVAKLHGDAAARELAYSELLRLEAAHHEGAEAAAAPLAAQSEDGRSEETLVDIAAAVALPLCEVLAKDVEEVQVEEFQRTGRVLAALVGLDPVRVGSQTFKRGTNIWTAITAPANAIAAVLAKQPASLTPDDAVTVACGLASFAVSISSSGGGDATHRAAGLSTDEWVSMFLPALFLMKEVTPSDELNLSLLPLFIDLIKAPETLPDFALGESSAALTLSAVAPAF